MAVQLGLNHLDVAILIIIGIFCLFGLIKGAIRQFFSILAFILAGILSIVIPYFLKLPAGKGILSIWGPVIFSTLIMIPSYLILNAIGRDIARRMSKGNIRLSNHIWGLFFGGIKGIIIIAILIFLVDSIPSKIKNAYPKTANALNCSKIISIIRPYNPFLKIPIIQNLAIIINLANNPETADILASDPGFQKLARQKSIKKVIYDSELKEIVQKKQYAKLIGNPKIQQLIKDPKAIKLLATTHIDSAGILKELKSKDENR